MFEKFYSILGYSHGFSEFEMKLIDSVGKYTLSISGGAFCSLIFYNPKSNRQEFSGFYGDKIYIKDEGEVLDLVDQMKVIQRNRNQIHSGSLEVPLNIMANYYLTIPVKSKNNSKKHRDLFIFSIKKINANSSLVLAIEQLSSQVGELFLGDERFAKTDRS